MSENSKKGYRIDYIIKYLIKKIPRLDEIVFDLGFLSIDDLVKTALEGRINIPYSEAEKVVLAFIIKSFGSEPKGDVSEMKEQIIRMYNMRDFLVSSLKKNRLNAQTLV